MSGTPEAAFDERFIPGRVLAGRYRVVEMVGRGGMGEVYRAHDLKLGQAVALKFLPAEIGRDPDRLEELFAEVRMSRQISHPNVCRVHDVEDMEGLQFLSMEFVDGEDLASLLRRIGRLPHAKAVELAREICSGLQAIHDRGVRHRDLKPANVMIDGRGHARITDFGLASAQGAGDDTGVIVGTPAYLAPECFDGGDTSTVQRDIYSLGLVLYELFTGRRAFEATNLMEWVHAHREVTPPLPSVHVRELDPRVERAILKCIDKRPDHRPASAVEVATLLPGPDPLAAALAAGETPSPEVVAAAGLAQDGMRPAVAWSCVAALVGGLLLLTSIAPRTRLVSALSLPDPPDAMAGHARDVLRQFGVAAPAIDRAWGFAYDDEVVEAVALEDRSPRRWERLFDEHPTAVSFWYRDSPRELRPSSPAYRVTATDPPLAPGMTEVTLDAHGRLTRLDAPHDATVDPRRRAIGGAAARPGGSPLASAPTDAESASVVGAAGSGSLSDVTSLFRAAGLHAADFFPSPAATPTNLDARVYYQGIDRDHGRSPVDVEVVMADGRLASFAVRPRIPPAIDAAHADPSRRLNTAVRHGWRPALLLSTLFLGAWLARRNLRAGRGDTKRALRVALMLMAARVAAWMLGGHVTAGAFAEQLASAIAWGLYDFALGGLSYLAIEPYVRRLWPRVLTTWMRMLDGHHTDPRVGRDLLIGCLIGVGIALLVSAHQAAPSLFGAPPGRPDNVGYVEHQLASLLGLRFELAEMLVLLRSNFVLILEFIVILVVARLTLRHSGAAIAVAFAIFVPLALPRGEFVALNVALAFASTLLLLIALLRFGLLTAMAGLLTYTALQAAPLGHGIGTWSTSRTFLVLALVLAVGLYGFWRALAGRPVFRDVLAEG